MATKRLVRRTPAGATPDKPNGKVSKRVAPRAEPAADYDEDDERMGNGSASEKDIGENTIRAGWGASHETIDSTSNYAQAFKPTKDSQVIKILDAKPYASFRRHWIDRIGVGKRAYICYESIGKDCPLCAVGDKPGAVTAFNVAVVADDGIPALKTWDCGVKLSRQLETFHHDAKIGPLDKPGLYFLVSKSEATQRQQVTTMVSPVRGKDLLEDYGIPPLDDEALEKIKAKAYTAEILTINPLHEMEEVAAEMSGEDVAPRSWGS